MEPIETIKADSREDYSGLKDLARDTLREGDDFKFFGIVEPCGPAIVNNIWYTYDSEKIKGEYFRFSHKLRLSLKIDGQEIPFATVKRADNLIFPAGYKARVEILPCMIPQALEGLALYAQTHPIISGDSFSKEEAKHYIREIQAVQKELYILLESTLLERKVEQSYKERKVA